MEIGNIIGIIGLIFVSLGLISIMFFSFDKIQYLEAREKVCEDLGGEQTQSSPIECLINNSLHPIIKLKSPAILRGGTF